MKNTILIFLALTACASAQPFNVPHYHRVTATAFTPASLESLIFWVSADSITGKASGDTLYRWDDLSGRGANLLQATASSKPVYRADSLNGKPCVVFDGSNDVMASAINLQNDSNVVTILIVAALHKPAAASIIIEGASNSYYVGASVVTPRSLGFALRNLTRSSYLREHSTSVGITATALYCRGRKTFADAPYSWVSLGADSSSSVTFDNYTAPGLFPPSTLAVGARSAGALQSACSIYEIAIYKRYLSEDDISSLRAYVLAKYGI